MQYDHNTYHKYMLAKAEQSVANMKDQAAKDPMRLQYHFMAPASAVCVGRKSTNS